MFKKEKFGKTNCISSKGAILLVFLFVLLALIISIILLVFSKVKIEIEDFRITSKRKRHINKKYKVIIKLCILNKIPILKIEITKELLEKLKIKERIKDLENKVLKDRNKFDKKMFKAVKKIKILIRSLKLKIDIGTENAAFTAMLIPIISTIIVLILQSQNREPKNYFFRVNPIYYDENIINIAISGIFEIKMIHIISIIYILNKKEGVKKYERTSNRRAYGYSYE